MMDVEKLMQELRRDEGFRDKVYTCSAGKQTIGYGHNLEDTGMPKHIAESLLLHDVGGVLNECESLYWYNSLSPVRKRVIANMMFNMGKSRLLGFKKMIAAIDNEDYGRAGAEMVSSRWYSQVGARAVRLVSMMVTGNDYEA